jgi:hypothetical protein
VFKPRLYRQLLKGYRRTTNVLLGGSEVTGAWRKCDFNQQQENYPGGSTEYVQISVTAAIRTVSRYLNRYEP